MNVTDLVSLVGYVLLIVLCVAAFVSLVKHS